MLHKYIKKLTWFNKKKTRHQIVSECISDMLDDSVFITNIFRYELDRVQINVVYANIVTYTNHAIQAADALNNASSLYLTLEPEVVAVGSWVVGEEPRSVLLERFLTSSGAMLSKIDRLDKLDVRTKRSIVRMLENQCDIIIELMRLKLTYEKEKSQDKDT